VPCDEAEQAFARFFDCCSKNHILFEGNTKNRIPACFQRPSGMNARSAKTGIFIAQELIVSSLQPLKTVFSIPLG